MNGNLSKLRQAALNQTALTDRIVFVCALFSVIIFPVIEGIIIQKLHNKPGFWYCIVPVGLAHLLIGGITILNTKPLPQYASEYEALEEKYFEKWLESETFQHLLAQSNYAVEVVWYSLSALRDIMRRNELFTKEYVKNDVEAILRPLIDLRSEVLGFASAMARYNFAVYLYHEEEQKLKVFFRECDNRIEQTNRSWTPGVGHVGICYARRTTIISPDIYTSPELWKDGKDSDRDNYRSMASTPIFADSDTVLGVLVTTSSIPNQFSENEHTTLFNILSNTLTLYFKYVNEHLTEGESYV